MRCPSVVYVASPREWQSRPAEPEHPGHWEVRRVRRTGEVKIGGGCPSSRTRLRASSWVWRRPWTVSDA
jgi:hypothetical protein